MDVHKIGVSLAMTSNHHDVLQEYKAQQQATIDKTARLRAQRLAKEKWQQQRLTFGSPNMFYHSPTSAKR
jgi:hypothetical protein